MKLQQAPGSLRLHWPPGGVHVGGVGVGEALEDETTLELATVLLDSITEEDDGAIDDEEMMLEISELLEIAELLGIAELLTADELIIADELTMLEKLEDDRVDEEEGRADDEDRALQFPNPAWHPVPQ